LISSIIQDGVVYQYSDEEMKGDM